MKIIDLLNKIANDEEVPKIILFNSYKYQFDKIDNVYRHLNGNSTLGAIVELDIYLNDEVEIIEEEKKPLTKQDVEALGYACGEIQKCFTNGWNKSLENKPFKEDKEIGKIGNDYYHKTQPEQNQIFQRKINEIIDKVNSLEKKQ